MTTIDVSTLNKQTSPLDGRRSFKSIISSIYQSLKNSQGASILRPNTVLQLCRYFSFQPHNQQQPYCNSQYWFSGSGTLTPLLDDCYNFTHCLEHWSSLILSLTRHVVSYLCFPVAMIIGNDCVSSCFVFLFKDEMNHHNLMRFCIKKK